MRYIATFGCGHDGRLGLGHIKDQNVNKPSFIPFFTDSQLCGSIISVHVGGFHTFVRTTNGVYGFGLNDEGQLGVGEKTPSYSTPRRVEFFGDGKSVIDIACGTAHTVAWMADGLYVCGSNTFGQLGLGDTESKHVFTKISSPFLQSLEMADIQGTNYSGGGVAPEVDSRAVITHVRCGTFHTLVALKNVLVALDDPKAERNQSSRVAEVVFYPSLLIACGKGDFGELGYDADDWDLLTAKERRTKQMVVDQARHVSMGGAAEDSLAAHTTLISGENELAGVVMKPAPKFKKPVKERRPEFYHPHLKKVNLVLLDEQASRLVNGNEAYDSGRITIRDIQAMHLHSSVTLEWEFSDPSRRMKKTFHFGCLYCNEIEGIETSIPVPVVIPKRSEGDGAVHAGDEIMFLYSPVNPHSPSSQVINKDDSNVYIIGKGNVGLNDDDSFVKEPALLSFPDSLINDSSSSSSVNRVLKICGRFHFLVWTRGGVAYPENSCGDTAAASGPVADQVFGFGDNLFGQVGLDLPDDKITSLTRVLSRGDKVLPPPKKSTHTSSTLVENPDDSILVERILDVACGSRHSVVVFEGTPTAEIPK